MLKHRVITAVILAIICTAALFGLDTSYFAVFLAIAVMLAAWEWSNLAGYSAHWQRWGYALLVVTALVALLWQIQALGGASLHAETIRSVLLFACGCWAIALLWVQSYPSSSLLWDRRWLKAIIGFLVLVPAWLSLVFLHSTASGEWLVLLVFSSVAFADIGAYFSGRAFGRHKLAPQVSPGKTWEGVWGGLAAAILLGLVLGVWLGDVLTKLLVIVPASLASVLGDLFESMLKRQRGIKDSSQLLPGHGGLLDRVDGLCAAAPVFCLAYLLVGGLI